jgi:homoserine O-succinyltransferase
MLSRPDNPKSTLPERYVPWIDIGLLNNMPDAALEATENQFAGLLQAAAGTLPVRLHYYSLPEIPRGDAAQSRINALYGGLPELWRSRLDALIVTGAEPRTADLRQEPFWTSMVEVIEWCRGNVESSVWSCLAAHAAVLHLDGVLRKPLSQKSCGVFEHTVEHGVNPAHPLTRGLGTRTFAPHSRWNQVTRDLLLGCGYDVLTYSAVAGVNLFAKRAGSLFVFWQGHPEYDEQSLLKEYQRDIGRYLRGERESFPTMPQGYFDQEASRQLLEFQTKATAGRHVRLLEQFPVRAAAAGIANTWAADAVQHYRNWLQMLVAAGSKRRSA